MRLESGGGDGPPRLTPGSSSALGMVPRGPAGPFQVSTESRAKARDLAGALLHAGACTSSSYASQHCSIHLREPANLTDGNIETSGYIFACGATSGLRINGNDYGNTIYQNTTTIGGQPANIGFILRDANSFIFAAFSTAGVYTTLQDININRMRIPVTGYTFSIGDWYLYQGLAAGTITNSFIDELKLILDNNDKKNLEIAIDDTPYNNRYKRRFVIVVEISFSRLSGTVRWLWNSRPGNAGLAAHDPAPSRARRR
jgi:hypothetical protein